MQFFRKLPIPQDIKSEFPITPEMAARREACIKDLKDIFSGKSDRMVLVIGP